MPSSAEVLWASVCVVGRRNNVGSGRWDNRAPNAPSDALAFATACHADRDSSGLASGSGSGTKAAVCHSVPSAAVPVVVCRLPGASIPKRDVAM